MQLTERQEQILRSILETYIATARPVGSAAIVAASGLRVSSATIRHEMAALEALAYIQHLHTSGGRVPTNAGYRYYVERLMSPRPLPHAEARTIRHQFHQIHQESQEWLKLAATVMASRMRNVALITAPRPVAVHMRHTEVISIQGSSILLIVVLRNGAVLQEKMALDEPHAQEALSALATRLNRELQDMTAAQVEHRLLTLPSLDARVAGMIARLLRRGEERHADIYHAGLADMIRQPEFLSPLPGETAGVVSDRLPHMVEFLQQSVAVERLLHELPSDADIQVVIGDDTGTSGLEGYSFVLGRYGSESDSMGFLGIIGPTRMRYPQAVSLVRYMTDLMTDLIQV